MLVEGKIRIETEDRHPELNAGQRQAVDEVFLSREKIVGLDGVAGAARRRRWPWCARARSRPGTRSKALRPRPARRRSWRAGIETKTLQAILPEASGRTRENTGFM